MHHAYLLSSNKTTRFQYICNVKRNKIRTKKTIASYKYNK
uniref:Uncharacterized protein n=1 Tax=Anguilla anguilla TaxID=7936 RepID=A0A0E9W1F7_ANGAN